MNKIKKQTNGRKNSVRFEGGSNKVYKRIYKNEKEIERMNK